MNVNSYRLIFSKRLGMLVPVSEQATNHHKEQARGTSSKQQKSVAFLAKVLALSVCAVFSAPTFALPTDPTIVQGVRPEDITTNGNVMTIINAPNAIVNFRTFNIDAGEAVRVLQESANSRILFQVIGTTGTSTELSRIHGTLYSTGIVWLINQAGFMIGPGAVIDTAGFVASTLKVKPEDFLAGQLNFQATAGAGDVVNKGEIRTPSGGFAYLVGTNVSNEGIITTPNGETILAAGTTVSLMDTGTPGVKVDITGAANNATNLGSIVAAAGRIGIAGTIVRNSGTLNASSVVSEGGRIFLKASQDTYVDGNGRIVTTGTKGGKVEVLGNRVAVMDNAEIDASGTNGGGTILVGGDFQGKNPDIQNAQITYFGTNASLKANATDNGDGGKVIVWADDTTRAFGRIEAKGGTNGGDGGFVEVSGKQHLTFFSSVDTRAPNGSVGTLLLDPTDITIVASATPTGAYGGNPFFVDPSSVYGADTIGWDVINGALSASDVIIQTSSSGGATNNGSITINASGTLAGSGYNLSLLAENNIDVNYGIYHSGSGDLTMVSGWDSSAGDKYTNPQPTHASNTGNMTFAANADTGTNLSAGGSVILRAKGALQITDAVIGAGGDMEVAADSLTINATTRSAGLLAKGDQSISMAYGGANGIMQITSTIGDAHITSYGSQSISFYGSAANTLSLQGSNSATTYGGNAARIKAGGTQEILRQAGSLAISVTGGTGTSTFGNYSYGGPSDNILLCSTCAVHNGADIESVGNQHIVATSLTVQGGSTSAGFGGNYAEVESNANQHLEISGAITVTGGATGGVLANAALGIHGTVGNDAGLHAEGSQTISAGSITVQGGGASYGGAMITSSSIDITTTGNLTLTGGAANSGDLLIPAAPAIIGNDTSTSIELKIGGTLTMSGAAGSPTMIGAFDGTPTVDIYAYGGFALSGSSDASGAYIGRYTSGSTGSVSLTSGFDGGSNYNTSGATMGMNAYSKIGNVNSVNLTSWYGGLIDGNNAGTGGIIANSLTATANGIGGGISLLGLNRVSSVNLTAESNITYHSESNVTISATSTGSDVDINTNNATYGGNIYLGTISANNAVTITARDAIYENNGVGNVDITAGAGGVALYSNFGGTASGLAISADVNTTGNISSRVYNAGGSDYGGIRIYNASATAPGTIWMQDDAAFNASVSYFNAGTWTTGAQHQFLVTNEGNIAIGSGGALTLAGGTFSTGNANGSIGFAAASDLTVSTAINRQESLSFVSGGLLDINSGLTSTGGAIQAAGLNVNVDAQISAYEGVSLFASGVLDITQQVTSTAGGDIMLAASTIYNDSSVQTSGNIGFIANDYSSYGGELFASGITSNIEGIVTNNIKLDNGASIRAGDDVSLALLGSASELQFYNGSTIEADSPLTIYLDFLGRPSGGIYIDGVQATTAQLGTVFFNAGQPATAGSGLQIAYGVVPEALTTIINEVINSTEPPATKDDDNQTTTLLPPPSSTPGFQTPTGETTGGGENEFGSSSSSNPDSTTSSNGGDNSDDKPKDKAKEEDTKTEREKEKAAKKKLARCG